MNFVIVKMQFSDAKQKKFLVELPFSNLSSDSIYNS